jgi:hypothetical protein
MSKPLIALMLIAGCTPAFADRLILRSNPRDLEPYEVGTYSHQDCQTVRDMLDAEHKALVDKDGRPDPNGKPNPYYAGNVLACVH